MVWIVAITIIFIVSIGWYVSQPVVMGVASAMNSSTTNPQARTVAVGVQYVSFAWGPVLILFVLLWAVISSSKHDVESTVWGG